MRMKPDKTSTEDPTLKLLLQHFGYPVETNTDKVTDNVKGLQIRKYCYPTQLVDNANVDLVRKIKGCLFFKKSGLHFIISS